MVHDTEEILDGLLNSIAGVEEVHAIGVSGRKTPLTRAGESDIDIFIYCDVIPGFEKRKVLIDQFGDSLQGVKINVFEGGHRGIGDFVLINGVETWLMYFSERETLDNLESILRGDYPDKMDNYYYPIGRCAMLKNINILYDENDFLLGLKHRLSHYPDKLATKLIQHYLEKLEDTEDLERAVNRNDVLFYHFAIDIAIDHFLQALFAVNRTFFPSRKRTLDYIENFNLKPQRCSEKLLEVVRQGGHPEGINQSFKQFSELVNELRQLCKEE